MNASLNEKLKIVEWGEYKLGDLFEKIKVNNLKIKTSDLPKLPTGEYTLPALTAGIQNQGLNNYVQRKNATVLNRVISISANGTNTGATFYQKNDFTVLQDAYAVKWIYNNDLLTDNQYLFLVSSISKRVYGNYEWTNKAGWEKIKSQTIQLPTKNGEIDFDFMDRFIAELEEDRIADLTAYLCVSGQDNYELSEKERKSLESFNKLKWKAFNLEDLFGKSTRGKRLKGADRIQGNLPFVTAGETDTGISAFIGNDVEIYHSNTTTIDMFGSAKYRNYEYGGDDHIAVVHTEKLPMKAAIFVTAAIHKSSHNGQFDYGKNFYAKDADELWIMLPVKGEKPDYGTMELIISAIQKLTIKNAVIYNNSKIKKTK